MADPALTQALRDGEDLFDTALNAIKSAIDAVANGATADIPKLSGDALAVAEEALENLAPVSVRPWLAGLLGSITPAAGAALSSVNARAAAALKIASANVDAAIGAAGSLADKKFDPGSSQNAPQPGMTGSTAGTATQASTNRPASGI